MIKNILLLSLVLFFVACSQHPKVVKPYEKAFADEDTYIIFALRAEQLKNFKKASDLFEKLYDKADKKEYLYRSLQDALLAKENAKVVAKVDAITKGSMDDAVLIRLKVLALMEMGKLDEAKRLATALATKTQKADDYLLAGDVFIKNQEFEKALKYLESAYTKEYNEKILDKIAVLLYANLHRKKDAIAYLETHTRVHGCSKRICNRLIGIYSNENNIDGLLSVYKRLYALDKNDKIAKKIIQIYAYKRDYVQLINFLEESGADDEILLQLYTSGKDYKKASKLAQKLYEDTGDINYLGQNAIYEYESYGKSISKEKLQDVIDKLEKVVKVSDDPLYLNYLGYILIDHNVDVKKGMKYVKKVLKENPDSAYYIDSLAWGYYKLGECKKAKKLMNKVVELEGGENAEVLEHVHKIDMCLKKSHKSKR